MEKQKEFVGKVWNEFPQHKNHLIGSGEYNLEGKNSDLDIDKEEDICIGGKPFTSSGECNLESKGSDSDIDKDRVMQKLRTECILQVMDKMDKDMENNMSNKISTLLDSIKNMLIEKNKRYGNSALEPLGIFSKQDNVNSITIRLDDKLSRIKNSTELRKNDVADTIGYLCLLCIAKDWNDFNDLID